ncbi:MAG: formate--tetrahydrofolate ligase [Sulfobacillus acidophilus]|uniref:Formate--tetrahydrofolate ligase n=1 Tax=Sulfobacillus acidophilus TaxID=53633 RepID=A0A2T2WGH6_9FIRM|nr:MAG: formate--tetrahydrofolate ligase [Sulfobacillus acidophilus]
MSSVILRRIGDVAEQLGLRASDIIQLGPYKAKIPLDVVYQNPRRAKLVLMTAINPTPAGEGKTTMSIGLAEAMNRLGVHATAVLREPSLGPTFGMKGGATGGGNAQVQPATDINLHFTGDFHAITAAHNLLAALIDNELYHGSRIAVNPAHVTWKRVLDVNDRALRHVVIGLGGASQGVVRESGFDITAASEVMAVLTLSKDFAELKERLGQMIVARSGAHFVSVADLKVQDALAALLTEAILPNLVQTTEGTPAIIHGGPFANIAHGCNSIVATEAGLRLSDVVITEAGFGADLGAEKFLDIKAPAADLRPDLACVVVTLRALRYHGGQPVQEAEQPNREALHRGMSNLFKHLENLDRFGVPSVVAINQFDTDTAEEIQWLQRQLQEVGVSVAAADVFSHGGAGGSELAQLVHDQLSSTKSGYAPLYGASMAIDEKIATIAGKIYGADAVEYSPAAQIALTRLKRWGLEHLKVCVAKTQYSLSDNPAWIGRPEHFTLHIRDIEVARGAGYVVPLAGSMIRMPGLPPDPAAYRVTVDDTGTIHGIY